MQSCAVLEKQLLAGVLASLGQVLTWQSFRSREIKEHAGLQMASALGACASTAHEHMLCFQALNVSDPYSKENGYGYHALAATSRYVRQLLRQAELPSASSCRSSTGLHKQQAQV